jgi:hypothetical protein
VHIRQLHTAVLALVVLTPSLAAQTTGDRLQTILDRAAAAAATLESSLPSFTCKEQVRSQEFEKKEFEKKKLRRHIEFTADLTVQRRPDGSLNETFQPTDWRTILLHSESGIPFYVTGGFQRALVYFSADHRACYRFTLASPQRLDFTSSASAASDPLCKDAGLTGFALLDAAGNIVHVERRVPPATAHRSALVAFAAMDLAPVELNGQTYRLSSHLTADTIPGRLAGHFEADYTQCHLFHTTVTIEPGAQPAP